MRSTYKTDSNINVSDSEISGKAHVWKNARIETSTIADFTSIGEESIILSSSIGEKCEIGRRNTIIHTKFDRGGTQGGTL